jgi:two-component system nitrogen regulation sensor histidine kinase GlnL
LHYLHYKSVFIKKTNMILSPETRWLIDNLSTAVLLFDTDLRLRTINPAGETLLSLSARQILGQRVDELLKNSALADAVCRALLTGHAWIERDIELPVGGQEPVIIDCTITPLAGAQYPSGVLLEMINADTHRRIIREETLQAQYNITRALIRGIAHEIKNPLGGIRGAAQLLERKLGKASHREYTTLIINEADRLHVLLDRMLGPSSLPQRDCINIHETLEHVRGLVEAEAPATILIKRDYDPSLPEFWADRDQLIQALLNIVRNAVQALGDCGEIVLRTRSQRQFTIGSKRHKLVMRVDVIDNGPGIPPEIKDDIFFPLVTGRAEGTGLGLSIAQSLIHNQGGLIELYSEPSKTIFSIWLPIENGAL